METNIFKKVALAISLVAAAGCDIEPVYFNQVAPDTFYDSKEALLPPVHAREVHLCHELRLFRCSGIDHG